MTAIARIDPPKPNSSTQLSSVVTATEPATIEAAVNELEDRTFPLAPGLYRFRKGQGMTDVERGGALRAMAEIKDLLTAKLDIREAHKLVRALLANMRQGREGFDADSLLDGMELALEGRSGPAFREAVRRVLAGEAGEGISKTFAPSTAELVTLTKVVERSWELQRDRLMRLLRMEVAEDTRIDENAPLTDAQQAMLAKMRAALPAAPRAIPPGPLAPTPRLHGPSPAARVAAETAARRAAQEAK